MTTSSLKKLRRWLHEGSKGNTGNPYRSTSTSETSPATPPSPDETRRNAREPVSAVVEANRFKKAKKKLQPPQKKRLGEFLELAKNGQPIPEAWLDHKLNKSNHWPDGTRSVKVGGSGGGKYVLIYHIEKTDGANTLYLDCIGTHKDCNAGDY